tara:strand:- start:716 stop:940 length:225 start_codon:yes stop_codon:yes gene_type:complete
MGANEKDKTVQKKQYQKGDALKGTTPEDLNSENFKNKDVMRWHEIKKSDRSQQVPKVPGLSGIGVTTKLPRYKK